MPLNERERLELVTNIAEVVGGFGDGEGHSGASTQESATIGLTNAFERLLNQMTVLTEVVTAALANALAGGYPIPTPQPRATAAAPEAKAEAAAADPAKPKNKGGRPKKAAKTNGTQGPDVEFDIEVEGATEGGADEADPDPFRDPSDNPHHGHHEAAEAEEPKTMTESEVKDVLRAYMQTHGTDGTAKLTDLLQRTAGVKRFSEASAAKWLLIVRTAKQEMSATQK